MTKLAGGVFEKDARDQEAKQLRKKAKARRAEATAEAGEERRKGRFVQSRAQAVAAASGGSLADPTIINIMGDLAADAEFNALTALYEGDTEAKGLRAQASVAKKRGRAALVVSAFDEAESLASKYG
jgi:propanediol dehydratase small subunit